MRLTQETVASAAVGTRNSFLARDDFLLWSSRGGVVISSAVVMGTIPPTLQSQISMVRETSFDDTIGSAVTSSSKGSRAPCTA